MKTHLIVPVFCAVSAAGLLIWRASVDQSTVIGTTLERSNSVPIQFQPIRTVRAAPVQTPAAPAQPVWPNTEVVNALRGVDANAASHRAAIAKALPVLATDQDVQLLVGDMLIGAGDPIDGLAWLLLACMHCTPVDLKHECVAEGLCDPNLAYIDVLRRDFGEQAVADALERMKEIEARIATGDPSALAIFTEIDAKRFPKDVGECVQLRTPTPECPPEEILRQTKEAYE